MDVAMLGSRMLSSQNGLDHGPHHGWAMDALLSERKRLWPWMFSSRNGLDRVFPIGSRLTMQCDIKLGTNCFNSFRGLGFWVLGLWIWEFRSFGVLGSALRGLGALGSFLGFGFWV